MSQISEDFKRIIDEYAFYKVKVQVQRLVSDEITTNAYSLAASVRLQSVPSFFDAPTQRIQGRIHELSAQEQNAIISWVSRDLARMSETIRSSKLSENSEKAAKAVKKMIEKSLKALLEEVKGSVNVQSLLSNLSTNGQSRPFTRDQARIVFDTAAGGQTANPSQNTTASDLRKIKIKFSVDDKLKIDKEITLQEAFDGAAPMDDEATLVDDTFQ